MNSEKVMRICKVINKITVILALVSFVLPIIMWNQIPDTIPTHFGPSGRADAWGDKSSLILVLILVLVLLGVMNIAIYYVKVNELSFYPMLVVTNLGIQCLFSYLIFASMKAKENLDIGVFVITLIGIFGPIIWFLMKYGKHRSLGERKEAQEREAHQEGIVYRSRIDWWLAALLLVPTGFVLYEMVKELLGGIVNWPMIGTSLLLVAIIIPLANIKYVLYGEYLKVSCSYFGTERVRYEDMVSAKKTYNPLSSAALSVRRIQIDYVENGAHKMVLISPKNRDAFIEELRKRGYTEK